jgi:guanosine-3',5'-bis(diphosphate) 3'-pyrophosphohydrolase
VLEVVKKAKEIHTISEATTLLWEYLPNPSPHTKEAYELSKVAHKEQFRKSGEPYVVHPILVAAITAYVSRDEMMVQAALLHDVVEDTSYTIEEVEERFGEDVAHLVEGLTKIVEIRHEELIPSSSHEKLLNSALTFRKMLLASIKDVRVLIIKLCDRLHNMLTLEALTVEKQKRIAEETLVVYAPIAHRLGISQLKNLLEDSSFAIIYPQEYAQIESYLESNQQNLQMKLNGFIQEVSSLMIKEGFLEGSFEVFGRIKHYYSIYMKMQRKGVSIDEVLDLVAVRILVNEPIACYNVLGLLHLHYTPLPSRFKDYIAVPKENGYKTIHTTLFSNKNIIEAQIRTKEMHSLAEYGVAAHWKYKEGGKSHDVNLAWLESLHYQNDSVEEFYALAKSDLFSEDITVFSPKGDYFTLPKGSIALDFAYRIHSEVGDRAMHALINKQKSSLLTVLKNGDIVNILTGDRDHLHCSWVDTVKTSRAQNAIRLVCKARLKESNRLSAYNILATEFGVDVEIVEEHIQRLGQEESVYKLLENVEYAKEVAQRLDELINKKEVQFWKRLKKGYKTPQKRLLEHFTFYTNRPLEGVEFDYCCHPRVGDEIVAFYKESKAIIHHKLCKKAYSCMQNRDAMVLVAWSTAKQSRYRLLISLQNQKGVLAALLATLSKLDLNILRIELDIHRSDRAEYCQIDVESLQKDKSKLAQKIGQHYKLVEITSLDDAYNV